MVSLPTFKSARNSKKPESSPARSDATLAANSGMDLERPLQDPQKIKRATKTRKVFALLTSFFLFVTFIFLILVEIGSTYNRTVLKDTYFFRIDLSNIVPSSIANAQLLNSIARTIGLHDYYQVGLWGFCEGYNDEGVTYCSKPESLYWFNPVKILVSELLAGASIALPTQATQYLHILKVVSEWMFGLFLSGICMAAVMMFVVPISVYSRWLALPVAIFTFLTALVITVATVIATAMFIIFKMAMTAQDDLNISAQLGTQMFAFMWIASGCAIIATLVQTGLCCCCASRRDVKHGWKRGSMKAYTNDATATGSEKQTGGSRRKA